MSNTSRAVRFLLAEDDDDHAGLVERVMRTNRVANEITRVRDGEQALAYLRRESPFEDAVRPDIILHISMPKMTWHEVLAEVKSDPVLQSIPVILLTTSQSEIDKSRAHSAHANSYLVKPLNLSVFTT
ncbi:MAG: response regulator [Planctomycetota bacterium]